MFKHNSHDSKTGNKGAEKVQQLEAWRTCKSARSEKNRGGYRRGYRNDGGGVKNRPHADQA